MNKYLFVMVDKKGEEEIIYKEIKDVRETTIYAEYLISKYDLKRVKIKVELKIWENIGTVYDYELDR